jgi:hypothetical protein
MASVLHFSETCKVRLTNTNKSSEAVVQSFKEKQSLNVVFNKSIIVSLKWNGHVYEGRAAGLDFESDGPDINYVKTGVRG